MKIELPILIFIPDCDVGFHSVAETILLFFDCLPDSIIPSELYEDCLKCAKNQTMIPKVHYFNCKFKFNDF